MADRSEQVAAFLEDLVHGLDLADRGAASHLVGEVYRRWPDLSVEEYEKANETLIHGEARRAGLSRAQRRALGVRPTRG